MAIKDTNNNELVNFSTTASAVNEITVKNAATANAPEISATGTDTNIDLKLTPKGSGNLVLDGLEFPNADGSASQVLQTNGSGVLSFATPAGGKILQVVTKKAADQTITNPGTTYTASSQYTQAITPTSATSKILIMASGNVAGSNGGLFVSVFRDSTNLGQSVGGVRAVDTSNPFSIGIMHIDEPATTSSISYSLRVRRINAESITVKFNNSIFEAGGVSYNQEGDFILMEIAG